MHNLMVSFHDKASKNAWMKAQALDSSDWLIVNESDFALILKIDMKPFVKLEDWGHFIFSVKVC